MDVSLCTSFPRTWWAGCHSPRGDRPRIEEFGCFLGPRARHPARRKKKEERRKKATRNVGEPVIQNWPRLRYGSQRPNQDFVSQEECGKFSCCLRCRWRCVATRNSACKKHIRFSITDTFMPSRQVSRLTRPNSPTFI